MAPDLNESCDEALTVWSVMGGWFPERLPVVLALLGVERVDGLLDRLLAIRAEIAEQERERRADERPQT